MKTKHVWIIAKKLLLVAVFGLSVHLTACNYGPRSRPESNDWVELYTLVDGVIEITVSLPRPKDQKWLDRSQFESSETNKLSRIFIIGYDQGRGKLSGANLVYFYGAVLRIENEEGNKSPITFEDIANTVYLSRPEKLGTYRVLGEEMVGKDKWLKIKYAGDSQVEGITFYKPISDRYAISISMRMFGEDSDKTKLFQQRYQDYLKALGSVKVTIADFADQSN